MGHLGKEDPLKFAKRNLSVIQKTCKYQYDDWVPLINNSVVAVLVATNIIYIRSSPRSFANGYKRNPATVLSGAATFTPKPWFGNSLYYKLIRWQ
jgi:hypothetical protein